MEGIIIDIQNDSYVHLCNVHYHIILSGSNCISAIFLNKAISASFTVMGPLIWYVNAQVRMWIILDINNNDFHHLGKSQISPLHTGEGLL